MNKRIITFMTLVFILLNNSTVISAATINVTGKAKALNTDVYLDFTNYNSNVTVDSTTGDFYGYAFSEDIGWVAFGTTDNAQGPVNVDVDTGVVTGKAKVLNASDSYIDFTNYNSNVVISGTDFSGYAFSQDLGWFNFGDTGVDLSAVLSTPDTTPPEPFSIESPKGENYTNSERPLYRWKSATDSASSISSYAITIDNGTVGDISVDNISPSRTEDIKTAKYIISYKGFSDSDSNNNFIEFYTLSSGEWSSDQNDGKLREGKRHWKVTATDTSNNTRDESVDFFVDRSAPILESLSSQDIVQLEGNKIRVRSRITDKLQGDTDSTKVASGPSTVEIEIKKKDIVGISETISLRTLQIPAIYWSHNSQQVTDNKQQTSNKYADMDYLSPENLSNGKYEILVRAKDISGNISQSSSYEINIGLFSPSSIIKSTPTPTPRPRATTTPKPTTSSIPQVSPSDQPISESKGQKNPAFSFNLNIDLSGFFASVKNVASNIITTTYKFGKNFARYQSERFIANADYTLKNIKRPVALLGNMRDWLVYSAASFQDIVLNEEPTRIMNVEIAEVGTDYAIITWETNHFTSNNKVNYGESKSFGQESFGENRVKRHIVKIDNLKPNTNYIFEVMSQGKNYTYDAHYEFQTISE